jgi:uncharacterized membrane protein
VYDVRQLDVRRLHADRTNLTLLGLGILCPLLLLASPPQPLRAILAIAMMGFLPGYVLVRLTGLSEWFVVLVLSVAVSLSLSTVVSMGLLYARVWSWQLSVGLLGLVAVGAVLAQMRRTT